MSSPIEESTSMKSSSSLTSLNSFKANKSNPVKIVSNCKFTRSLYSSSSLRIKKRSERSTFADYYDNLPSESQISLYSLGSLSTDDFNWSTFRPNYLKMMNDTNLLDSCAEAKQEMESIRQQSCAKRLEFFETDKSKNKQMVVDAEQLLKWIAYMEKYLETFSPSWIEVKKMNSFERNTRLNEQCDLRQYIASHNRIVSEMIREQDNQRTRNIEEKYQILLLNAIEKQCLLEGYPELDDYRHKSKSYDNEDDVKLDVYKLCSIDIEPQNNLDELLDYTITQSTESLAMKSDTSTITSADDGIHFPTHPTTSKSSLFSEDHYSPFSSNLDFRHEYEYESLDDLVKELDGIEINYSHPSSDVAQKHGKNSKSSITQSTLKLIEDVDLMLPKDPTQNIDEFSIANKKVDSWLLRHPQQTLKENQIIKVNPNVQAVGSMDQKSSNIESDRSSHSSNFSIGQQWDNFQEMYTLTAPYFLDTSDDFLYFGNDYDDVLKSKSGSTISSISEIVKSVSTPTSPSKSEKSSQMTDILIEAVPHSRKRKRITGNLIKQKTVIVEKSISYNNSEMARDILLITEDLRNNYMNIKPKDFDGILKICRENLGCLILVLDKEQRSHSSIESIECVGNDDKIYIQENCRCGIIGRFISRIVNFLYECSRKVRKTVIYRYLMKILKGLYSMVKFLSERVRVYRNYYGKF